MADSKILIVDDEARIREQLARWLQPEGFSILQAENGRETLAQVKKSNFNVILLDLVLPDVDGLDLLAKLNQDYPDICVIALTGQGNESTPAKAREAGAFDFFEKPIHFENLINRIDAAVEQFLQQRESFYQQQEKKQRYQYENIIGDSDAMQKMFGIIRKVADSDSTILIEGESGTGKEMVAGAIHFNSSRQDRPLIIADCAALPETLAESELFGHEKGAFTGAEGRKIGRFERADRTTLLVDEVGELPPAVQLKFLRFLQEGTIQRVGGLESIKVDVRIIAATNKDLTEAVEQKEFRQDLFFRLNAVRIRIPPLRQRHGDIPKLVEHFIKRNNRRSGRRIKGISPAALKLLESYHFPGNVRELENIIENATLLEEGDTIQPKTIQPHLLNSRTAKRHVLSSLPYREAKREFECQYFSDLLERFDGNVSQTARFAEMDRSHLTEKLKMLGVRKSKDDDSSVDDEL